MRLHKVTKDEFVSAITNDPADKFAKTFVAKANMQEQWECGSHHLCMGLWDEDELTGAIITSISKREPKVANLQLLHTFAKHRGKGVGKTLCLDSLRYAMHEQAKYFRVSAEIPAIEFYKKIGFDMLGEQKSGCQLSMFKINSDMKSFDEGDYNICDPTIFKAVYKKGKGGCVKIFKECHVEDLMVLAFDKNL